jgi:proline iminopeptidase
MGAHSRSELRAARAGYVPVQNAELYYREIGEGQPIIVLHGGPDFSHHYLLPDMDRLTDGYRLIYYDQRGRGLSAGKVKPEDVSLQSEIEDLEVVREYLGLDTVAVLGHSWGGILAMEYAIQYPQRVSHMILMNTAPASHAGFMLVRAERREKWPEVVETLKAMAAGEGYQAGEPDAVAAYYRVHFSPTLREAEYLERVVESLRRSFTQAGILKARAIEEQLMNEMVRSSGTDLASKLGGLNIPTLILHGDYDFIPIESITPIIQAIPDVHVAVIRQCGHFSFLERPEEVRKEVDQFFAQRR